MRGESLNNHDELCSGQVAHYESLVLPHSVHNQSIAYFLPMIYPHRDTIQNLIQFDQCVQLNNVIPLLLQQTINDNLLYILQFLFDVFLIVAVVDPFGFLLLFLLFPCLYNFSLWLILVKFMRDNDVFVLDLEVLVHIYEEKQQFLWVNGREINLFVEGKQYLLAERILHLEGQHYYSEPYLIL